MLANAAVTVAKISSGTATNGQVLTANGSGGASWQTPSGSGGSNQSPLVCQGCTIDAEFADTLRGKNLTNAYLTAPLSSGHDILHDNNNIRIDLSGTNFTGANLRGISAIGFSDPSTTLKMTGANFTNANLSNAQIFGDTGVPAVLDFTNTNFTNANLKNTQFSATDFSNANFTGADMTSGGYDQCTFTGATFSNTTCPDGTNSDAGGNTCSEVISTRIA